MEREDRLGMLHPQEKASANDRSDNQDHVRFGWKLPKEAFHGGYCTTIASARG